MLTTCHCYCCIVEPIAESCVQNLRILAGFVLDVSFWMYFWIRVPCESNARDRVRAFSNRRKSISLLHLQTGDGSIPDMALQIKRHYCCQNWVYIKPFHLSALAIHWSTHGMQRRMNTARVHSHSSSRRLGWPHMRSLSRRMMKVDSRHQEYLQLCMERASVRYHSHPQKPQGRLLLVYCLVKSGLVVATQKFVLPTYWLLQRHWWRLCVIYVNWRNLVVVIADRGGWAKMSHLAWKWQAAKVHRTGRALLPLLQTNTYYQATNHRRSIWCDPTMLVKQAEFSLNALLCDHCTRHRRNPSWLYPLPSCPCMLCFENCSGW